MADNMTKILYPLLLALAFLSSAGAATADDSKELRKQRQAGTEGVSATEK